MYICFLYVYMSLISLIKFIVVYDLYCIIVCIVMISEEFRNRNELKLYEWQWVI